MKAAVLAMLLAALSAAQAAAQPRVRVVFDSAGAVLVGQQFRVDVTVVAPNFFLSPPQFPLFDIPGTVVTLPDEIAQNSTEAIDGETYAAIRRSYLITPQRAGDFVLPPAQITFQYAAEPGKPGVAAVVTLPPQAFTAQLPAGANASASSLVTKVVVTQTLNGDLQNMKAGGALTRTIETFAPNTQAMMIPPPVFEAPDGVRVYLHDPLLTDVTTDRGDFTGGQRVDQVTYVFEKPGAYTLPAVEVHWFDASAGREEVSAAAQINLSVAQVAATSTDLAPPAPPEIHDDADAIWKLVAVWILGLVALATATSWAVRQFGQPLSSWLVMRRQAYEVSELSAFARLKRSCLAGDAGAAYHYLGVWARRAGFGSIRGLCEREPLLLSETTVLDRRLYGGDPTTAAWSGSALVASVTRIRTAQRAANRNPRVGALPALNPWERPS
jgi:hypothetical protein